MLRPALLAALGVVASGTSIVHEELADSANATRTFCIYLNGTGKNALVQPSVSYRYHNDSKKLLLHQHDDNSEVFSAKVTLKGTGTVEYIITAGTEFWTPQNASFGSFKKLEPPASVASAAGSDFGFVGHTLEDVPHGHYYTNTGSAYFLVVFALFGSGIFLACIFFGTEAE